MIVQRTNQPSRTLTESALDLHLVGIRRTGARDLSDDPSLTSGVGRLLGGAPHRRHALIATGGRREEGGGEINSNSSYT